MNICTSDCPKCQNCTLEEESKAKVWIICSAKDRKYFYGKIIDCDDFCKRREDNEED